MNITRAPDFDLLVQNLSGNALSEDYTAGKVASKANRNDDDENGNVLTHSPSKGKPVSNISLTRPHYITEAVKNTGIRATFKGEIIRF